MALKMDVFGYIGWRRSVKHTNYLTAGTVISALLFGPCCFTYANDVDAENIVEDKEDSENSGEYKEAEESQSDETEEAKPVQKNNKKSSGKQKTTKKNEKLSAKIIESQVPASAVSYARDNIIEKKYIELGTSHFLNFLQQPSNIFISDANVLDSHMIDKRTLHISGTKLGVTTLVILNQNKDIIGSYVFTVTPPISRIKEAIANACHGLSLQLTAVNDCLMIQGDVASPEIASNVLDITSRFVESSKIINKMSIVTATQVMLKVKIAEVSRTLTKSLGINWRALSIGKSVSGMSYGFTSKAVNAGTFPEFGDVAALRTALMSSSGVFSGKTGVGEWLINTGGDSGGLSALIQALANESFASVLAEPTLVTLSGKTAVFKSGGEQGYVVRQSGTSDSNTMEFKEWGTSVEFTPVVISEDRIYITVKPVVSTVSFGQSTAEGGDGTPALSTKSAETTVELGSGQSLVIAGLLQVNKDTATVQTPLLSDLPLFGALFRTSNITQNEKELIIIVTPYIVKPSSKPLKAPTDMVPHICAPLESIINRSFHRSAKRTAKVKCAAGYMVK